MTTRQAGKLLRAIVLIWAVGGLLALPALGQQATRAVTVELTVAGQIQLNDPWTSGSRQTNQWAKPIYRICFDTNGDPKDGAWGNGQGVYQAQFWLDTARMGFRWNGPDGQAGNADDVQYWPIQPSGDIAWAQGAIIARLADGGKTLKASIALAELGNPDTLEVSFMCSPWTSSASDNLGRGGSSRTGAWIVVPDTSTAKTYEASDPTGDNGWPSLRPNNSSNFDLVKAKVIIQGGGAPPPGPDDRIGPRRPTSATGLVSDTAGRPIEGAVVTLRFSPTEAIHGITGADGRYLTGETYLYSQAGAAISAKARDYQETGSSNLVKAGPNTFNFTLTPKPITFTLSGPFEIGPASEYQYALSVKNSGPAAETVAVAVTAEENSSISQATGAQLDATSQVATWSSVSVAQNSQSSQTFSLQPVISATDPQPPKISVEVTRADGSTLEQEYGFTLAKPAVTFFGGLHVLPDNPQSFQLAGWVVQSQPMDWLEGASVKAKVYYPDGTESGWLTCTEEKRRIIPTIEIAVPDFVKDQYPSQAPDETATAEQMTAANKGTLWWPMYCAKVENKGTGLYKFEVSSTPAGEYIPSIGTCHSRIGVKDVFEVKDADVLQIEDVEYAGQDTYNLVIRNISDNCYRVILPDGRSRLLLRKDTWKPAGGVQAAKLHSGAGYLHRFVIEAEFSMGVYFVQSAWVLAFQEPPPHDVLEGLLKAVGKYLGKPVDAIYQMDGKKVFMAFLDVIKDRPDLLAKCVSTKVAEKLAKQATVVFNTINMAEAIIWQLNTVSTTMRASHDVITVDAGKPTVN